MQFICNLLASVIFFSKLWPPLFWDGCSSSEHYSYYLHESRACTFNCMSVFWRSWSCIHFLVIALYFLHLKDNTAINQECFSFTMNRQTILPWQSTAIGFNKILTSIRTSHMLCYCSLHVGLNVLHSHHGTDIMLYTPDHPFRIYNSYDTWEPPYSHTLWVLYKPQQQLEPCSRWDAIQCLTYTNQSHLG